MLLWHKFLIVFMTAAAPITELRAAIPLGVVMGFTPLESLFIALAGNLAIVPILLLLIEPLFVHFKRLSQLRNSLRRIEEHAAAKMKRYRKYRLLGLFVISALPIPGAGAYTACLAARLVRIRFLHALAAICAGTLVAGILVYSLTYHVVALM